MTTWLWIAFGAVVVETGVILCLWRDRNDWQVCWSGRYRSWQLTTDALNKTLARLAEYEPEPILASDAELGDDLKVEVAVRDAGVQKQVAITYGRFRLECWTEKGRLIWSQWQVLYKHVKEPKQPPAIKVGTHVWEHHTGKYLPQDVEYKLRVAAAKELGGKAAFHLPP